MFFVRYSKTASLKMSGSSRPDKDEESTAGHTQWKSISAAGNSECKGPEAGTCLRGKQGGQHGRGGAGKQQTAKKSQRRADGALWPLKGRSSWSGMRSTGGQKEGNRLTSVLEGLLWLPC